MTNALSWLASISKEEYLEALSDIVIKKLSTRELKGAETIKYLTTREIMIALNIGRTAFMSMKREECIRPAKMKGNIKLYNAKDWGL